VLNFPDEQALRQAGDLAGASAELHSAFSNLLANAMRYTPAGGQIDVRWQLLPDGSARFAVKDSGPGIDEKHVSRLTERFYRVDRSRSRDTGGTGLGLAIVKHVLQRHGARLSRVSWARARNSPSPSRPAVCGQLLKRPPRHFLTRRPGWACGFGGRMALCKMLLKAMAVTNRAAALQTQKGMGVACQSSQPSAACHR
jgi:hypothetical protein